MRRNLIILVLMMSSSVSMAGDDALETVQSIGESMLCGSITVATCIPATAGGPKVAAGCGIGVGAACAEIVPDITEKTGEKIGEWLFSFFGNGDAEN